MANSILHARFVAPTRYKTEKGHRN